MVRNRLPSPFSFLQLSGLRVVTRVLKLVPRLLSPVSPCLTVEMCPDVLRNVPLASPGVEVDDELLAEGEEVALFMEGVAAVELLVLLPPCAP